MYAKSSYDPYDLLALLLLVTPAKTYFVVVQWLNRKIQIGRRMRQFASAKHTLATTAGQPKPIAAALAILSPHFVFDEIAQIGRPKSKP